jgi:type I restriction enzyme M protein
LKKPEGKNNCQFDVIVANPHYSVSGFKNTMNEGEKSFDLYNRLTDTSSEIESLFIERTKQLLKTGGYVGIVLPSSVLTNGGIYTDTREIILKNFEVIAIAEFGSNTFMATGTNTITLFLKKRDEQEWKRVQEIVDSFFKNPIDMTCYGIEKAFSKYVGEIYQGLTFEDYVNILKEGWRNTNQAPEMFKDYERAYKQTSDYKNFIKKSSLNDETNFEITNQRIREFILLAEADKLLYFMLSYNQKVVIVKTGEGKDEKEFLGYEFSNRRGYEGMKMFYDEDGKPTTKLYAEALNEEKANYYIYNAFLGNYQEITDCLADNISMPSLHEIIKFESCNFAKEITTGKKKLLTLPIKYSAIRIGDFIKTLESGSRPEGGVGNIKDGILSIGGEHIHSTNGMLDISSPKYVPENYYKGANKGIIANNDILICKDVALTGKVCLVGKEFNKEAMINEHVFLLRFNSLIEQKYMFYFLWSELGQKLIKYNITGMAQGGLNSTNLLNMKIPLPPIEIQRTIVKECEIINEASTLSTKQLMEHKKNILDILNSVNAEKVKIDTEWDLEKLGTIAPYITDKINISDIEVANYITTDNLLKDYRGMVDFVGNPNIERVTQYKKNDILVSNIRPYLKKIWLADRDGGCSNDVMVFRSSNPNKILSKYIFHILSTDIFFDFIMSGKKGIKMPRGDKEQISQFQIPLPPLDVQKSIVEEIEKHEVEIKKLNSIINEANNKKKEILEKYLN